MTRLESSFESDVVDWAKVQGGKALKLKNTERGFPDRTIILPQGFIAFAELKRENKRGKRYEQQKEWIAWLRAMGFPAAFCESMKEIETLCQ